MKIKQLIRDAAARLVASLLPRLVCDPKYFRLWQARGAHVLPVHFYHPIPDTRKLKIDIWDRSSDLCGIRIDDDAQLSLLAEFAREHHGVLAPLCTDAASGSAVLDAPNASFGPVDAEVLFAMIRHFKPKKVIEIGSGVSTIIISRALCENARDGASGELCAIEPYPSSNLSKMFPAAGQLIAEPVQNVSLDKFVSLQENDILFIDSSHVCKIGSDVQYELLEIVPRLSKGVVIHFHDIFLPAEYPMHWVLDERRFWNEQYLLQAFLSGNESFNVIWAGSYMHLKHSAALSAAFTSYRNAPSWPASFWIQKIKNA